MLIRTTVSPNVLIKKGVLEVNPDYDLNNLEDLNIAISTKVNNTSWAYIYLPAALYKSTIDLTDFLAVYHMFYLGLKSYSQIKEAKELSRLRLFYFLEATNSIYVVDLDYIKDGPVYRPAKITVYDELGTEDMFKQVFELNMNKGDKLVTESIQLDFVRKELKQNIVLNDTLKGK